MRIRNRKQAFCSLIEVRFLGRSIPLAVRWQLTDRCVFRCKYCNIWKTPHDEFSLEEIIPILDEMAQLGTQTISFSGGEPMLRQDIGPILYETSRRGISTEMNSTGAFIPENIAKLQNLDFLKISLDGPEEIHDLVRGKNAYKIAMAAAEAANAHKIKFIFSATLTKFNIHETKFLLAIAKKFNTLVAFQPIKGLYRGITDVRSLEPNEDDYRSAIKELIALKRNGNPNLRNSLIGLHHIYHWPRYPALKCWSGKIFCILNTDGTLAPCDRISYNVELPNCRQSGFKQAFNSLPDAHCSGCGFCGVLELNFIMSYKFDALKSVYSVIK